MRLFFLFLILLNFSVFAETKSLKKNLDKLKKQTEIKVNFNVIANVPLYKNINQKDYSIVKLKKEEI